MIITILHTGNGEGDTRRPTGGGRVCRELLRPCWQSCEKQMQQHQAMLGPAVHRGKGMTYKTSETMCNASAWLQQFWKSCANRSKIVALRFDDHETKEMLGVVGSKV